MRFDALELPSSIRRAGLLCLAGAILVSPALFAAASVDFYKVPASGHVLTADLNGDGFKELLLSSGYSLDIYWYSPTGYGESPDQTVTMPASAVLFDVGMLRPGIPAVFFLTTDGLYAIAAENGAFSQTPKQIIPRKLFGEWLGENERRFSLSAWNFALDLDGDKLAEFLLPIAGGFEVYFQRKDGPKLTQTIEAIGEAGIEATSTGHKVLQDQRLSPVSFYTHLSAVEAIDLNGDGLLDLVVDRTKLGKAYFIQNADGTFTQTALTETMAKAYGNRRERKLFDVDGDGIEDSLEYHTPTRELLELKTQVTLRLANPDKTLPAKPSQVFVGANLLVFKLPIGNFRGAGTQDIAMFDVALSINKIAQWINIQRGKIAGDLNFYFFDKKRRLYDATPSFKLPLSLEFKLDAEAVFTGGVYEYVHTMITLDGDFNGDGLPDLLVRDRNERLAFFYNRGGNQPFPRVPDLIMDVPDFRGYTIEDLNGDGISDIMLDTYEGPTKLILLSHRR